MQGHYVFMNGMSLENLLLNTEIVVFLSGNNLFQHHALLMMIQSLQSQ